MRERTWPPDTVALALPSARWRIAVLLIGALALATGLAVQDVQPVGVFHDDAMYVILAKSLATGEGYRYLNLPGTPVATHFPPGYPALLAMIWRFAPPFPANLAAFKAMNAVFFGATAVLMCMFARDRLGSDAWAVVVGALSAVSVPLLVLVTMVLSEPLFLLLLVIGLRAAERFVASPPSYRSAAMVGAWIGVLVLVRTHGCVLLPAVALPLAVKRRYSEAGVLAAVAVSVALPWQLWSSAYAGQLPAPLQGNYGSYLGWWIRGFHVSGPAMIRATLQRTVPETGAMLAALFSPARADAAHVATLVALATLLVLAVVSLRRCAPVTLLFLAGYVGIALVWPFPPTRFFWGIWPLLLFLLVASAASAARGLPEGYSRPRIAILACLVWVAVGHAGYEQRAVRGAWWGSISRAAGRRIDPAVAWTLRHTSPADVVAADDEGSIYLYTGRLAVPVASFTVEHYLDDRSAAQEAGEGLEPLLLAYPIRAVLVGSSKTLDAAEFLTTRPVPPLALRDRFPEGAAFTVLTR